jgi:hypothetical protein
MKTSLGPLVLLWVLLLASCATKAPPAALTTAPVADAEPVPVGRCAAETGRPWYCFAAGGAFPFVLSVPGTDGAIRQ